MPEPVTIDLTLGDEAATGRLAAAIAALARPGDVIALAGDLGSGKTSFARAFINALPRPGGDGAEHALSCPEGDGAEEVPSPTFTLVQVYERTPAPVWHFDLYRLRQAEEAYELGFEEALATGIVLIEWPERLGALLPADHLRVALEFGATPAQRHAGLTGHGAWAERLVSASLESGQVSSTP